MKTKLVLALFILVAFISGHAEVLKVVDMKEVFSHFEQTDRNAIVVFDVDMVLLQPTDPAFQMANMKRYSAIYKKIMKEVPDDRKMLFLSWITIRSAPMLVDSDTPKYFQQLIEKGVPAIALTANLTGSLGPVCYMEKKRIDDLRRLGIDFSKSTPYSVPLNFAELPTYRGFSSSFLEGVLFANGTTVKKGELLLSFFQKSSIAPKKVIFVDDREENLLDVEKALLQKDSSIEFLGLHYLGAEKFPSQVVSEEEFSNAWTRILEEIREVN